MGRSSAAPLRVHGNEKPQGAGTRPAATTEMKRPGDVPSPPGTGEGMLICGVSFPGYFPSPDVGVLERILVKQRVGGVGGRDAGSGAESAGLL